MGRWSALAPVAVLVLVLPAGAWLLRSHHVCGEHIPVRIVNTGDVALVDVSICHLGNDRPVADIKPGQIGYVWLPRFQVDGKTWGTTATLTFRFASGGAVRSDLDLPEAPSRVRIRIGPKGPSPSVSVSPSPWWLPLLR